MARRAGEGDQEKDGGRVLSTLYVCPSAVIEAPIERVWTLLTRPESFDLWVDAKLVAAEPDGPARPGQVLRLRTGALGLTFAITIKVREVDTERRQLRFLVELPFGIENEIGRAHV